MPQLPVKSLRTPEDYWAIARRRRWWLILPLFLGWVMVLTASFFVTPKYRSETVIIVEPQRVAEQYVVPNISADMQERMKQGDRYGVSRFTMANGDTVICFIRGVAGRSIRAKHMRTEYSLKLADKQYAKEISKAKVIELLNNLK